jgi:AcrR family transcriptional regulator
MARTVGSTAEQTRQRILDAAQRLFVERGYAGTSVRDIVEQLDMTKGSLYYHFASKDDLLFALTTPLVEAIDEFAADVRAAGRISTGLLARLVDRFDEHAPLMRAVFGDPSVVRGVMLRHRLPERMAALQAAMSGDGGPAAVLRGQCALGVIHAGVLSHGDPVAKADGGDRPPGPGTRCAVRRTGRCRSRCGGGIRFARSRRCRCRETTRRRWSSRRRPVCPASTRPPAARYRRSARPPNAPTTTPTARRPPSSPARH